MEHFQKPLTLGAAIIAVFCLSFAHGARTGYKEQEWVEVTARLQQQIDECRRDTRDFTKVERDIKELQARVLFLEDQLEQVLEGEKDRAALMFQYEEVGE